jgi:hypothetical protein
VSVTAVSLASSAAPFDSFPCVMDAEGYEVVRMEACRAAPPAVGDMGWRKWIAYSSSDRPEMLSKGKVAIAASRDSIAPSRTFPAAAAVTADSGHEGKAHPLDSWLRVRCCCGCCWSRSHGFIRCVAQSASDAVRVKHNEALSFNCHHLLHRNSPLQ